MNKTTSLSTTGFRCLSLPGVTMFPGMSLPVLVTAPDLLRQIEQAWNDSSQVIITPNQSQKESKTIGCLVEIKAFKFDGNHDGHVVLQGVSRVRCDAMGEPSSEIEPSEIEFVQDVYSIASQTKRAVQRKRLLAALCEKLPSLARKQMLLPALECELPFGALCDLLATSCQLSQDEYGSLLTELDVDRRCELLCNFLTNDRRRPIQSSFPPSFSEN